MNKRSDAAVQHVFHHGVTHILGIPRLTRRTKEVRDRVSLKFTEKQQQLDTTINEINMLSHMLIYHTTKLSISITHADGKNKHGKTLQLTDRMAHVEVVDGNGWCQIPIDPSSKKV